VLFRSPGPVAQLAKLARPKQFAEAKVLHDQLAAIFKTLFVEPNPVPVKHFMMRAGIIRSGEVRLPLCEMSEANRLLVEAGRRRHPRLPPMSQPIRILLNGAKGRMGLAIANVAVSEQAVIAAGVDQGDNLAAHIGAADVVIDFSFHSATLAVAQLCAQHKKPLVIGTTGHTAEEKAAITAAIAGLPVVWAGNYSVGVTLLNALVRQAARSLADAGRWDVEVLEMHHRRSEEHTSELQSRFGISYAVICLKKKNLTQLTSYMSTLIV